MFKDRQHGGWLLAERVSEALSNLAAAHDVPIVVVALPRGGVPVAAEVAAALQAPLTILVSKKIGAPGQPEFAIGAVSSKGVVVVSGAARTDLPQINTYINQAAYALNQSTQEKEQHWLKASGLTQMSFADKCCVIVDDGIATGMTALSAIETVRRAGARSIILAAPVVALSTKHELENNCDAVIAVIQPADLVAVGCYYLEFHQVEDDEVIETLRTAGHRINTLSRASNQ